MRLSIRFQRSLGGPKRQLVGAAVLIAASVFIGGVTGCKAEPDEASRTTGAPVRIEGDLPRPPAVMPTLSNTDPCVMRLHDICGALLLYAVTHGGNIPARLDELTDVPGGDSGEPLAFVCPASGKPYVYTIDGIQLPARQARVIIYDPTPAHSGVRWAVIAKDPQPDKPLLTEVIPLPESFFLLHPPAKEPGER